MSLENIFKKLLILKLRLQKIILKQKKTIPDLPKPRFIIIHHGGGDWGFSQVNRHHTNKWGFISSLGYGLGYQYWIEYTGRVYQARRDNEEGAHTVGNTPHYYNRNSIGICLRGNMEKEYPTTNQLAELKKLIDRKKTEYNISNLMVLGHREVSNTLCPGKYLWKWLIKNYLG